MLVFYFFGAIWAPPNGPKRNHKGTQRSSSGGTYGPMSKFKNKPLTKLLGPFFKEKWSKTTRNRFLGCFLFHFEAIWASSNGPKKVFQGPQVDKTYGRMS
jgi:hypothetical protein